MRHVGIHQYSVEGAVLCYQEIMRGAQARLGAHQHPLVTMAGLAMADTVTEWDDGHNDALRARSAEVVERLARGGAEFFLCPDNTAHIALEIPGPDLALPGLHIGEVVANEAAARGYRKVGVLGTSWTMQGPVYPRALEARGIGWAVPPPMVRERLHAIIMDELCLHRFEHRSIESYRTAIDALAAEGCDSVALVCTESRSSSPTTIAPCQCSIRPACWRGLRSTSRLAMRRCPLGAAARSRGSSAAQRRRRSVPATARNDRLLVA